MKQDNYTVSDHYEEEDNYTVSDHYEEDEEDDEDYSFDLLAIVFFLLMIIGIIVVFAVSDPKPKMGYGGSSGHMTPMEVEELGRKNQK